MDFVTVRELRTESGKVWDRVAAGEDIIVTRNGKPFAILAPTQPSELEADLRALRAARFDAALKRIRMQATEAGTNQMTLEEINAEIAAARRERRERADGSR